MKQIPPMSDAVLTLSEGQASALATLESCRGDDDARRSVEHWIRAWDKALGRTDTIGARDRIARAQQVWAGHLFTDGAGI